MHQTERTDGPDDHALLDRLGRTLAVVDPPPPWLLAAAQQLLPWRTVDTELAELLAAPPD